MSDFKDSVLELFSDHEIRDEASRRGIWCDEDHVDDVSNYEIIDACRSRGIQVIEDHDLSAIDRLAELIAAGETADALFELQRLFGVDNTPNPQTVMAMAANRAAVQS